MTMISHDAPQSALRGSPDGLLRVLGSWMTGLVTWIAHRHAIRTLRELDDRGLRDIGIERSRIESAVRGAVDMRFTRIM